jgi:hypothetical protein
MPQGLKTTDPNRVERVGPSGIYPASGPLPPGDAPVRGQGALAHPGERHDGGLQAVDSRERMALAIGRALFGGYFLYNGINHFLNRRMLTDYARSKQVPMADVGGAGIRNIDSARRLEPLDGETAEGRSIAHHDLSVWRDATDACLLDNR